MVIKHEPESYKVIFKLLDLSGSSKTSELIGSVETKGDKTLRVLF